MEAVCAIVAPLGNIATQLHHIAVTLRAQLVLTITGTVMAAFITQPQTGDFLLAGQRINIVSFTQTVMQAGDKQVVGRRQVSAVTAGFRPLNQWRRGFAGYLRNLCRDRVAQIPVGGIAARPAL
ncbi:Uncharacterised protein [Yersinia frederiksenii]|nr:Uncharacterised protein [Yersinia frederiksenii]